MSDINPHSKIKEYACDALAADVEFADDGPGMVRNIYVITAGAGKLRVVCGDGSTVDITGLEDGTYVEPSPGYYQKILNHANTDCDLIRVGW